MVRYAVEGRVARVTLDRPSTLNAIDDPLAEALLSALQRANDDARVRAVVLTGSGRGFCAGGDRSTLALDGGAQAALARRMRTQMNAVVLLREMPKVTIAAVNGPCAGAGMGLALAADLRVASSEAVFRTAFLDAGLSSDYGVSWLLVRLLGAARARELFFARDRVDAEAAREMGLVHAVVPAAQLERRVAAHAERATALPPLAVAALKANLADSERLSLSDLLDAEARRVVRCQLTADAAEAAAAFEGAREPRFRGA